MAESDVLIDGRDGRSAGKNSYNAAIPSSGPKFTKKTLFGDVRNWRRFSWWEWLFVVIASLSILTILGMSIERFVTFERQFLYLYKYNSSLNYSDYDDNLTYICNNWTCTNDFIFTVVLVLNIVFSAIYMVQGLLQERMFALVAYNVAVLVIMIYVVVNYCIESEKKARHEPLRLIRLVLVVMAGPINIIFSSFISYRMGFYIFTTVGVNTTLIRAYKIRAFLMILQVMLLQAMANVFTLSWARDGLLLHVAEKIVLILLLVLCIVIMILGFISVMFELPVVIIFWVMALLPYFAYFAYKISNVAMNFTEEYEIKVLLEQRNEFKYVHDSFVYLGCALLAACLIGLILVVLMCVFMALTYKNFRKGLKEKAPPPTEQWQGVWRRLSTIGSITKSQTSPIA